MINVTALKEEWENKGLTQKEVSNFIGASPSSFSKKLKKGILGSEEINILISKIGIKNPVKIFFTY